MLQNIHVKNLALIDEADLDLYEGFNVLTGETGAGKSILLGSIELALGGKYQSGLLRDEEKPGLVELTFAVENESLARELARLDIEPVDGSVVFTRRLTGRKSIGRINGETVSAAVMRRAAQLLIDIHGQHDSQILLKQKNHMTLLDGFADEAYAKHRQKVARSFEAYRRSRDQYEGFSMDDGEKLREMDLLRHEIGELEEAGLTPGEDELLEEQFALMNACEKNREALQAAHYYVSGGEDDGALSRIGMAMRQMDMLGDTEHGRRIYDTLADVESMLQDCSYAMTSLLDDLDFSPEQLYETRQRLDLLNHLKSRYGNTIEAMLSYLEKSRTRLDMLEQYDEEKLRLQREFEKAEEQFHADCRVMTQMRVKTAKKLEEALCMQLQDLNFLQAEIEIHITESANPGKNGADDIQILISTNPGENPRPLSEIASGGELSRIMLAFKSILADKDETPTLIFDEIDTGISGITAGRVAEKLKKLGEDRQVICITHLPQIAAAAHEHFYISKDVREGRTKTTVSHMDTDGSVRELARMLGGEAMTDHMIQSAMELKGVSK